MDANGQRLDGQQLLFDLVCDGVHDDDDDDDDDDNDNYHANVCDDANDDDMDQSGIDEYDDMLV